MASSFSAERTLDVAGKKYKYFSMAELPAKQLPYSLKILLENMLRTEDGAIGLCTGHREGNLVDHGRDGRTHAAEVRAAEHNADLAGVGDFE